MSAVNAFNWREFVQPVVTVPECLKRGQPTQFITAPRKVVQGEAKGTRLALNSAGRFVQVRMAVTSTSIAPKSDCWGEYE